MENYKIITGDFLAGGGGVTEGMTKIPGVEVKWVLNHDQMAIRTNMFNHKGVKHFWVDMYKQDEHKMDYVDLAWASIECTQHSRANGGRDKKMGSYTLGWELIRYIKHLMPYVLGIENVPEFKEWGPVDENGQPIKERKGEEFTRWKNTICALGYDYHESIRNAADDGIPTRRVRYFAFFTRKELGMHIVWPNPTHNKNGTNGLKKWVACKNYIDLTKEGNSIFGRSLNPNVKKGKRTPLTSNTLRRIAGGIKKYAPELNFIFQYYGNGDNVQKTDVPLNTITTKDRHVLVSMEKLQFIADHCHNDNFNLTDEPSNPILTWQTKQFVTLEKKQFLADYYTRDDTAHSLDGPANTITCENSKHIVTSKLMVQHFSGDHSSDINSPLPTITTVDHNTMVTAQFISKQYNSNGKPEANNQSIEEPCGSLTTQEKIQFITAYFSNSGKEQNLITALKNGEIDFDVKMRFLEPEELSRISTFPKGYFTNPLLKLTKKEQVRLIGNAVPPDWAKILIEPVIKQLQQILSVKKIAV
jgi:DNA (cytosine-5)-methyltransferase 1